MWDEEFFDGVAMGSPFNPVIANFFMEHFEQLVLESARLKPKIWHRYINDTFVIWSQSQENYNFSFNTSIARTKNIQFIMEKEDNSLLPFLVILISRDWNRLGHNLYRKPKQKLQPSS